MTLPVGHRIDGYDIEAVLGAGGFGVTYRVRDVKLGLRFALKEYFPVQVAARRADGSVASKLGSETAFEQGLERFLREGRTLAGLEHPNIARVVRHFEAGGTAWLLMNLYEGRTLHALLVASGLFRPAETQALLEPLLDALAALEAAGVIHGDIKPSNILVCRDGTPVLLDFGAARLASEQAGSGGATAGSAGYAAVEQTLGEGRHGPWTDIYGLAATLYRLVTGEIPAPSEQRWQAVSAGGADPLRPTAAGLAAAGQGGFSERFAGAVDEGLALAPERRPANVRDWRARFGTDVAAASRPGRSGLGRGERRVWVPQFVAGAALLGLLGAALWVFLGSGPGGEDRGAKVVSSLPDTSLARDDEAWEQAVRTDTAQGFRAYLEAFPDGRQAEAAREQLARYDENAWQAARDAGDLAAYDGYLERFPDGRYVVEAEALAAIQRDAEAAEAAARAEAERIDDQAYTRALAAGTIAAFDDYLAAFPGGRHVSEALAAKAAIERAGRDQAAWEAALAMDERAAYEAYVEGFPQGRYLAEALAAVERLTLRPGKVFRDCDGCPEMIVIPAGTFQQGAGEDTPLARSNERPSRSVRIARPFAIGIYEVTFAEWDRCVAAGACRAQPVDNGWGRHRRPLIMISWADAQAYVGWLSALTGEVYDLPTESQWEYVARAGEAGAWVGGSAERVCDQGNVAGAETGFDWRHAACSDPFSLGTAEVGYFAPNAMGVHDMVGNVAEWTRDCMNLSYLDAPADGSAWQRGLCSSRVTRGGSWFSGSVEIRLSARFALRSGESNDFTGLRVVREVDQ